MKQVRKNLVPHALHAPTFRSPVLRGSEVSLVRKRCLGFTFAEGGHKIKNIESNVRWLGRDQGETVQKYYFTSSSICLPPN